MAIPKISDLTDRELMEQIFTTQVVLMQSVYRIEDFLMDKYVKEMPQHLIHKDAVYMRLLNELRDFDRQYHALLSKKEED